MSTDFRNRTSGGLFRRLFRIQVFRPAVSCMAGVTFIVALGSSAAGQTAQPTDPNPGAMTLVGLDYAIGLLVSIGMLG